jgi:uncharacterized RDD family membrane protein YckC
MNWYYANGGQQLGPVDDQALAQLSNTGAIQADTLVWHDAMADWQPLRLAAPHLLALSSAAAVTAMPQLGGIPVTPAQKDIYVQQLREGVQLGMDGLVFAGWWARLGARILDGLILMLFIGIIVAVLFGIGFAAGLRESMNDSEPPPLFLALMFGGLGLIFFVVLFYEAHLTAKHGATWGKSALGIKVVNADGSSISTGRSWGRCLANLISSQFCNLLYLMPLFDDQKRALHDYICDTRVVRR